MIPYGKHNIDDADIAAVVDVLKNEFLTQGKQVPAFERALCEYTGASHAVAVNSGTSGLHIACLAAGIEAGDIVWTVPNSFAASANCALYCGASVDFVDIDPDTRNLSPALLQEKLHHAAKQKALPKALVVVHFAGSSCDMRQIADIVKPYNITLIEDGAHALGGEDFDGNKIGGSNCSSMTVLSFHPVKSITTAEGGAVLTNHADLAQKLRLYASHGITREKELLPAGHSDEAWYYAQQCLGYNYRLSDLHAALGLAQLKRLDSFIHARRKKAEYYHKALAELPVIRPPGNIRSAWHLYVIELLHHDRKQVFEALRNAGIGVNVHYIPIHWHPYYQKLGFAQGQYPASEKYYQRAITLPLYAELTADMQDEVIRQLKEVLM
ncbi:UDP-4-amino-4,6-dideoxy-N-acetyl-beta-L-altrosamine transaminase [Alteromonas pelagimontana]|uniref:UDP-4-amino-4, 6-dideoxy-N-acetyl-beta-L-altrosamine transaminase n=1 Tax=Alteromonas pelagimontana TaxID=1858656 RepID=A0A6M4MI95_9ALTE|nr:UDP-4-amino-4,6-dideoxy-N-acetyl-beta-L-altrosamine transaminase [Alteromonas pelagimontana]QJR81826.1 UDP-4-amino-4,6-dideoxy-N-acetyl-beta-L-altrosamine transaminase [Alteromonas pelagimontana]